MAVRSTFRIGARRAVIGLLLAGMIGLDGVTAERAQAADTCKRSRQGPSGTLPQGATWRAVPPGPVDGRTFASVVWTGREVIVWGGEAGSELARTADGAAYDPRKGTWRPLAASPISPRSEHIAVWTSKEMIVWGGIGLPGETVRDAAAYDPTKDEWRRIPKAPIEPAAFPVAVWTGNDIFVWSRGGGAAFDPARDRWRRIPKSPLGARADAAAVWTGCEVVIWGGRSIGEHGFFDDGATYNPATRRWKPLPASPLGTERVPNPGRVGGLPSVITARGFIHPNAVWTGDEVLVWGYLYAFRAGAPQAMPLAAYNPKTGTWRTLASPAVTFARETDGTGGERAVWTGDSMVALTGNVDVQGARALRYEPGGAVWTELPSPAADPRYMPDYNAQLVFTGTSVIAWQQTTSLILA
jgi:hypothetical protein